MKIYVAGPVRADTPDEVRGNIYRAIDAGIALHKAGHSPYISHFTCLVDDVLRARGESWPQDEWLRWDFAWLEVCDAVLVVGRVSDDVQREIDHAYAKGIPVFDRLEDLPSVCGYT